MNILYLTIVLAQTLAAVSDVNRAVPTACLEVGKSLFDPVYEWAKTVNDWEIEGPELYPKIEALMDEFLVEANEHCSTEFVENLTGNDLVPKIDELLGALQNAVTVGDSFNVLDFLLGYIARAPLNIIGVVAVCAAGGGICDRVITGWGCQQVCIEIMKCCGKILPSSILNCFRKFGNVSC